MSKGRLIFPMVCFACLSFSSFTIAEDEGNDVLAIVGDARITVSDFSSAIKAQPVFLAYYRGDRGKKRLLQDLMDVKLFSQEARAKGLDQQPRVQQRISVAVEKILAEEYMALARVSLKPPSENDLIRYYERHRGLYQEGEQVRLRHLILKTQEKAKEVQVLIKAGEELPQWAKEKCRDCKGREGGESDWIGRGRMSPEMEKVAFSLRDGEISEILDIDSAYHIIQLLDRKAPRQKMFFEVKNRIRRELASKEKTRITDSKRDELMKKYIVRAYPERLPDLKEVLFRPKMTDERFFEMMRERLPLKIGEELR